MSDAPESAPTSPFPWGSTVGVDRWCSHSNRAAMDSEDHRSIRQCRSPTEPSMLGELQASIPSQRFVQFRRQLLRVLDERRHDRLRFLAGYFRKHHVARMTFDQSRNVAVLRSGQQIAFPMTGHGTIFDRGRALIIDAVICPRPWPLRLACRDRRIVRFDLLHQLCLQRTGA